MINEKELLISGKSYINKDFSSIYPEEIDIFKKLTNRYDPETSNESDPMIVNLKTTAFVADKLCYNIDKNVLENFMPSATQESSMRNLTSRLGYEMKYYNASATDIYIKYTGQAFSQYPDAKYFNIPKFTEISSADGTVVFTTIISKNYTNRDDSIIIPALQGTIQTLKVADSDIIHLENLNSQNRLYFSESMVAENGVFVTSVDNSKEEWKKSDNLNLELPNTSCYKFGYDSVNRWPYIEFPSDIASLIGSGLTINYIVTSGESGNVNANTLTTITSDSLFYILTEIGSNIQDSEGNNVKVDLSSDESELIIKNTSASIGGSNPETIDEAYNNFKRTIGTFDTLVTCRDYANAIYNLYDENNVYPVVSNVQVADRRDDINYSNKVLTLDNYGPKYIYSETDSITAFDLCLYPLNAINSFTADTYLESFKPKNNLTYIQESLEEGKTISHDYKELSADDIYAIKNKYKLNVKLTTTYKVTQYERVSIIANVINALIVKFNSRNVDYGEEIPYETILETIQNADERINFVSLAEPEQSTVFMNYSRDEFALNSTTGKEYYLKVLAKNILAGKVSLFDFYDMFNFEFNQSGGAVKSELSYIESEAQITLADGGNPYTLQSNEVIQLIGPSFVTTVPYGYGVQYQYTGANISKDTEYMLRSDESLVIKYKQSGANDYTIISYNEGEIIKPNFDLEDTSSTAGSGYAMIQAEQEIAIRKLNESKLNSNTYCYWIRNTSRNTLFTSSDLQPSTNYQIMLQDGEYFFYKKDLKSDFISLGSGTILTVSSSLYSNVDWSIKDAVTIEEVLTKGSDAIPWKYLRFSTTNSLDIQETSILTLTAEDSISISNPQSGSQSVIVNNTLQSLSNDVDIYYTISGDTQKLLEKISVSTGDYCWQIKSRLDINAGPNVAQFIDSAKDESKHKIKFYFKDSTSLGYYGNDYDANHSFKLSENQQLVGSSHITTSAYDVTTNNDTYPLSVYVFVDAQEGEGIETYRNELGFINILVDGDNYRFVESGQVFNKTLKLPLQTLNSLLTIYYTKEDNTGESGESGDEALFPVLKSFNSTTSSNGLRFYNDPNSTNFDSEIVLKEGINVIEIKGDVTYSIQFESQSASGTTIKGVISLGELRYCNAGFNSALNLTGLSLNSSDLLEAINDIDTKHQFYYNSRISKDNLIDVSDLSSPYAFYDYNNIANKFTISEIDITNSNIDVVKTSLV